MHLKDKTEGFYAKVPEHGNKRKSDTVEYGRVKQITKIGNIQQKILASIEIIR